MCNHSPTHRVPGQKILANGVAEEGVGKGLSHSRAGVRWPEFVRYIPTEIGSEGCFSSKHDTA